MQIGITTRHPTQTRNPVCNWGPPFATLLSVFSDASFDALGYEIYWLIRCGKLVTLFAKY